VGLSEEWKEKELLKVVAPKRPEYFVIVVAEMVSVSEMEGVEDACNVGQKGSIYTPHDEMVGHSIPGKRERAFCIPPMHKMKYR
jgi:hypothetical protein